MFKTKDSGQGLDVKAVGDDGVIEGYGSMFDVVDLVGDAVVKGAFRASLEATARAGKSIKMLHQHNRTEVIGVWDEVKEDDKGLRLKGRLLKDVSPLAAQTYGLIKAGALDELSIGYREIDAKKDPNRPGVMLLKELDLREVSIVTFGALGQSARIDSVKSILDGGKLPSVREFEDFLRESGFSKSLSAAIAGKAAPHLRGEPDGEADVLNFLKALRA